ncbi:LytTR family DNA-binding domain-containing protein [uncultured Kordia sp.]|uniref:LytR/AlgR family response regulator transcription factor n=1 Tax=uncultured Kordia sp. TaxID=507699 RepID=UPI0026351D35|nr:LytTR family DNA-binding domain-containing protein [uncultured Kordia sp.]
MSKTQKERTKSNTLIHRFSNFFSWSSIRKLLVLSIFSLIVNHLSERNSFPDSDAYAFPIEGIIASITLGTIIGIVADFNFKFYKKKYFSKQVETGRIVRFIVSTLGYITLIYIPVYLIANKGELQLYYLLIGLLLTLLICFVAFILLYAADIYKLYRVSIEEAKITIAHGAKTTRLTYEDIACFYSENKVVYAVQQDGKTITTDFTLNELEETINSQLFFRANRQIILHINSIDQIEKIENGKLLVRLKISILNTEISEINISRYKRKAFMDWFEQKV